MQVYEDHAEEVGGCESERYDDGFGEEQTEGAEEFISYSSCSGFLFLDAGELLVDFVVESFAKRQCPDKIQHADNQDGPIEPF